MGGGGGGGSSSNSLFDDVRNESVKDIYKPTQKSEHHDQLLLNFTRQDMLDFFQDVWTDVYWLAIIMIILTFIGCTLEHHFDLRLRMLGAQMRIACCSLIYRKVIINFINFFSFFSLNFFFLFRVFVYLLCLRAKRAAVILSIYFRMMCLDSIMDLCLQIIFGFYHSNQH